MNIKWKQIVKDIDLDGDGLIDYHEFISAAIDKKSLFTTENIDYIFNTIDSDGTGLITLWNFKDLLPTNLNTRGELSENTL